MKYKNHTDRVTEAVILGSKSCYVPVVRRVLTDEKQVLNGRIVKNTVWKDYDPVKELGKYKCSDFCLANIIDAGAEGTLKYAVSENSNIDVILGTMDRMGAIIDSLPGAVK